MIKHFCLTVIATASLVGTAHAATVGAFTFDDNAFADDARIAVIGSSSSPGPAQSPTGAADGDLSTASNLNNSVVEILFTDNVLINDAGDDLVLFTNTNNNRIALSLSADPAAALLIGNGSVAIPATAPGNTSGFAIGGVTLDLSDLGVADGAEFTGGIFLRRASIFSTVWDVAALNSRAVVPVDPVPLPAGLPLLVGALGLFGFLRRRGG